MSAELQDEEREVLTSIYEGDDNFTLNNDTTIQYKFQASNDKCVTVEFIWPENYPEDSPDVNLDLFCNKALSDATKKRIVDFINEQSESLCNSAMTYTLIESVKENIDDLLTQQLEDFKEVLLLEEKPCECQEERVVVSKVKVKKEQLTKAQKKKIVNRQEKGELPRGWNWVDIISHLSQTANRY